MRFAAILFLALMTADPSAIADGPQAQPESSLHLQRGQLALRPYALGMTVAEAESRHGQALRLQPSVDDTGQCEGFDGAALVGGHPINLTFTKPADGLRIKNIFVRFSKVRDLDEVAAEVSRRVPTLQIAEHDPLIKGNKTVWTLPEDPLQTVSRSMACVSGSKQTRPVSCAPPCGTGQLSTTRTLPSCGDSDRPST